MMPNGWKKVPLEVVAEVRSGVTKGKSGLKDPITVPYLRVANVQDGHINLDELKEIEIERHQLERYSLKFGDVLMNEGGDFNKLGRGDVWVEQIAPCLHQNHVFAVRPIPQVMNSFFLAALAASSYGKAYFLSCAKRSTNLASINSSQIKKFPVLVPPLSEQEKIAKILITWDKAIKKNERYLINSKRHKKALAQKLFNGLVRFSTKNHGVKKTKHGNIPADWKYVSLGNICEQILAKNSSHEFHPVLSCSKYHGFVDSLKYFNKKVYSDDLSGYRIIPRDAFGFPSNHIEEGSIGYQTLYDFGLVSPIYVVFKSISDEVNNEYLYALLKTEHYRQIFSAATNASVDRRGSLRWKEFSSIHVPLPPLEEQKKISSILRLADKEIEIAQEKIEYLKQEKNALMQQLFSGKRRVKSETS